MIELYHDTFAYIYFFIMLISIVSIELVLLSLKNEISKSKSLKIYRIYFLFVTVAWIITGINEIIYKTVDLKSAIFFYCIGTFLLFLAFSEKSIKSTASIIIISSSILGIILTFILSSNLEIMLIISIYALLAHSYLLLLGITKSITEKNIGYVIMSLGFASIVFPSMAQIYYLITMHNLNITYSIAKAGASIGFLLLGIGLLASILIIEQNKYQSLSLKDPLTGLYNRRGLDYLLELLLSNLKRKQLSISAITLDIDFFKKINDTYGHDGGDEVLKHFAQLIKSSCRESDISSRLGGEEFVIILPETPLEGALVIAEKIRQKVEELRIKYNQHTIELTSSFGVASQHENIDTNLLLNEADKALYKAKQEGRNRVCHLNNDSQQEYII